MPPVIALLPGLRKWRSLGIILLAAGLVWAGWQAQSWRCQARTAQAIATATEEAREREQVLADAIAIIDSERTAERTKALEENAALRARVDAGAVRLRIRAACPVMSPSAAGAGLGDRTGAELAADARPDYFALRDGLTRLESKLAACQKILAAERGAP